MRHFFVDIVTQLCYRINTRGNDKISSKEKFRMYFIMDNQNNKVGKSNEEFTESCNEAVELHEENGEVYRVFANEEELWTTNFLYETDVVLYVNFSPVASNMRVAF